MIRFTVIVGGTTGVRFASFKSAFIPWRKDNFIDVYHTDYSNKRVILFTEQAAFREDLFPKIPKH